LEEDGTYKTRWIGKQVVFGGLRISGQRKEGLWLQAMGYHVSLGLSKRAKFLLDFLD
jgi:hypothetical protein